jgi:alpha-beta hydrolase superfamily lysophospholipase
MAKEPTMNHTDRMLQGYRDLALYAQRWQPPGEAKASIAIVHGFGEHSGRLGNVINWFVPKGYTVYAFDLRGHGRSEGRRGHVDDWDDLLEDVGVLLDWARSDAPDLPLFLLGLSVGGLIALDFASHRGQDLAGVIASAPALGELPVTPLKIMLARLMARLWPTFTQDAQLDTTALSRDASVGEAYASDPLVHGCATARYGLETLGAIPRVQSEAVLLDVPCLIVHGSADQIIPPDCSREYFEKMTLADKTRFEYDGYYHEVFNDIGKEQVLADVEAWIEKRLPER